MDIEQELKKATLRAGLNELEKNAPDFDEEIKYSNATCKRYSDRVNGIF